MIQDVIVNNQVGSWEVLKGEFNIPSTQKKTFTLVTKALCPFFPGKCMNSNQFIGKLKWQDGKLLNEFSSKQIYSFLVYNT